jgi:ATP-dependent Lon protease
MSRSLEALGILSAARFWAADNIPGFNLRLGQDLSIAKELDVSDLYVEVMDLMDNRLGDEVGLGVFIAAFFALKKAPPAGSWERK